MQFIRTLNQVQFTETSKFGTRACDLSKLNAQEIPIPTTFVITADAWKFFLQKNNLQYKIDFILRQVDLKNEKTLVNAYNSVRKLIVNSPLPEAFITELREAYESLSTGVSFDEMQKEDSMAFVSLLCSPSFAAPAESFEGIIQNVHGFEEVQIALKEIFAMMYTPQSLQYQAQIKAKSFSTAVIMQSMVGSVASATAYSSDPEYPNKVFIHSYKGYSDLRDVVPKDFFHVKKDFLSIDGSQVVEQTKIILRKEDGQFYAEEYTGRDQSLNDKQVIEIARLAKKSEKAVELPLKMFFAVTDTQFFVLFANRYALALGARPPVAQEPMPAPEPVKEEPVIAPISTSEPEVAYEEVQEESTSEPEPEPLEPEDIIEEEAVAPTALEEYAASKLAQEANQESSDTQYVPEESFEEESADEIEEIVDEGNDEEFYEDEDTQELAQEVEEDKEGDDDGVVGADEEYIEVDAEGGEVVLEDDSDEDVVEDIDDSNDVEEDASDEEYDDSDNEDADGDDEADDVAEDDLDEDDSDEAEDDDEEYEYVDEDGNPIPADEVDHGDDDEVDDEESDVEADDDDEEYDDSDDEEGDDEAYDDDDSDVDDVEEVDDSDETDDDDDEEYDDDAEDADQEDVEEEPQETPGEHKTFTPQEPSSESPEQEPQEDASLTKAEIKEAAQEINQNFRLIYAELVKLYEKGGNSAPDTITDLIQKGTQEGLFAIDGLHEALVIKKKARSGDEITPEDKNLVLDVLNELMAKN